MKKHLLNVLGVKYIYFLDVDDNARDLYNFLQTGEKKGVKNEN